MPQALPKPTRATRFVLTVIAAALVLLMLAIVVWSFGAVFG